MKTFRDYALEIIKCKPGQSSELVQEACEVFGIAQETVYHRIRSMFGDKLRNLQLSYWDPSTEEVIQWVESSNTTEQFREKISHLPQKIKLGLLDRKLGRSTFHSAKLMLEMRKEIPSGVFNPSSAECRSILAAARLGDSSTDYEYGRLRTEHSVKQRDWLEAKANLLKQCFPFAKTNIVSTREGTAVKCYHGTFKYKNQYKLPKEDLVQYLTPFGIMWLFLDDGCLCWGDDKQAKIDIAVENDEIANLLIELFNTYGYDFKLFKGARSIALQGEHKVLQWQQEFILPWAHLIPECMHYKLI